MPKYRIVIEDNQTILRSKVIEASSMDEATSLAELEDWSASDWDDYDRPEGCCEIRDDLCCEVTE